MKRMILGGAALLVGLLPNAFASTITNGTFAIGGTLYVTNFSTSAITTPGGTCPASASGMACIFWADTAGTGNGLADISATGLPNGDIPTSIAGNDAANISQLTTPPEVVGTAFAPTTFMTFNNGGITTQLDISFIDPGIYSAAACGAAAAVGQQCTLPGSLFSFVNNPPAVPAGGPGAPCGTGCQAEANFVLEGVTSGNPGKQSTWAANLRSGFPVGMPYQSVFALLSSQGYVSNTFSGTITLTAPSTVPEPGTMVFFLTGAGLIGLCALLRRRMA